jgi:hypothetical protein
MFVGLGVIAWSGIGLYISDSAEKKLGYEATEADRERLRKALPYVTMVDREK